MRDLFKLIKRFEESVEDDEIFKRPPRFEESDEDDEIFKRPRFEESI